MIAFTGQGAGAVCSGTDRKLHTRPIPGNRLIGSKETLRRAERAGQAPGKAALHGVGGAVCPPPVPHGTEGV